MSFFLFFFVSMATKIFSSPCGLHDSPTGSRWSVVCTTWYLGLLVTYNHSVPAPWCCLCLLEPQRPWREGPSCWDVDVWVSYVPLWPLSLRKRPVNRSIEVNLVAHKVSPPARKVIWQLFLNNSCRILSQTFIICVGTTWEDIRLFTKHFWEVPIPFPYSDYWLFLSWTWPVL